MGLKLLTPLSLESDLTGVPASLELPPLFFICNCFCMLAVMIPIFLTLSYNVLDGTPYFLLACRADIPFFTSSIAALMSSLVYCLYLFHSILPFVPITLTMPGAG